MTLSVPEVSVSVPPLALHQVKLAEDPLMDASMVLFEASFPLSEREPAPTQVRRIVSGEDTLLVMVAPESEVQGIAILSPMGTEAEDATLLAYLAVNQAKRSSGTGGLLLEAARNWAGMQDHGWLLIEIELPDRPAHEQYGDPARRARFYREHGALTLSTSYRIPNLETPGETVPFHLLGLTVSDEPCDPAPHVARWIEALWSNVYEEPLSRQDLLKMLGAPLQRFSSE